MHLPESYWLALIGGSFLIAQGWLAYASSRKTDNVAALEALVEGLQRQLSALEVKHDALEAKLEIEVAARKQAQLDYAHCMGALGREKELNIGHVMTIDKLKGDIVELQTQLAAANDYAARLRAEIHVLDPEHPEAAAPTAEVQRTT